MIKMHEREEAELGQLRRSKCPFSARLPLEKKRTLQLQNFHTTHKDGEHAMRCRTAHASIPALTPQKFFNKNQNNPKNPPPPPKMKTETCHSHWVATRAVHGVVRRLGAARVFSRPQSIHIHEHVTMFMAFLPVQGLGLTEFQLNTSFLMPAMPCPALTHGGIWGHE